MKKITLLICMFLTASVALAQVNISENFDSGTPTGWTDSYTNSAADACAGNSERDNLYSFSTTGNLTSPNQVGASNGTDLNISFDYKIEEWNSQTPQGTGWGTAELQYSTDDGVNWTTVLTIDDSNHTVSNSCATMMATVPAASLPNGSDVKLRILNTWVGGDYDFYVDNFVAQQNLGCTSPEGNASIVNDCVNSQYFIDVDVTGLGDGTPSLNDGTTSTPVAGLGVVQLGPYASGTSVTVTLEHGVSAVCDVNLGTFDFACPPANDDFANAAPIDCSSGTITGSTSLATLDEDDAPDGGGADMDAPNVWYALDSSIDGASDVTINLCGSSYDTSVLIYTGTSGNLTFVAANDDNTAACGQCCQSLVTFPTDGTSTYYIAVEGWNAGNVGDFEMVVSCVTATPPPANDECAAAEALTTGVSVSGTTVGATTSPGDSPTCDAFGSIADVWYSYEVTGGTSDLSISTTITGTSDQANVALYDDCAALAANSLGCSGTNGGETLNVLGLAVGTYYVRVWSDGNAPPVSGRVEGTFDIVVNATLSTGSFENEAAFTYYPNPVQNTLTLTAQNNIENVTMYNMLGQEVLRATPNAVDSELDMSSLQDGAYFVKVTIANTTKTIRVIKQ